MSHPFTKPEFSISPRRWSGILIAAVLLRLFHLIGNRSLWLDEAYLALNITESSYLQLLSHQPVIQEQAKAPLLFSLIVKAVTQIFGNAEWALRLFPFVCAAATVVLFFFLARRVVARAETWLAVWMMIFCDQLIYYAAELKPYAGDVFTVVGLYWLYRHLRAAPQERGRYILLAVAGLAAIWLSYPGIIVLGVLGAVVFWQSPRREKPFFFLVGVLWAVNVAMVYKFAVRPMLGSAYITGSIADWFPPAPLWTGAGLAWWGRAWLGLFSGPLGQPVPLVGAILFLIGAVALWRRDRGWCAVLAGPVLLTMVAAGLGKYPFHGRHLLFLCPAVFLLLADGAGTVARGCGRGKWPVALILCGMLLIKPMEDVFIASRGGREHEDNRAVMQLVADGYRPGDGIYMNTSAQYMFAYYLDRSGREADFLTPLSVNGARGLQGILIGKIDDAAPEFSYEILVYDRNGRLTGKSYLGRPDLGEIRGWPDVVRPHADRRERNWLVLSHIDRGRRSHIWNEVRPFAETIEAVEKIGAEARLFRWKD